MFFFAAKKKATGETAKLAHNQSAATTTSNVSASMQEL